MKKVTGNWDGEPISREETVAERNARMALEGDEAIERFCPLCGTETTNSKHMVCKDCRDDADDVEEEQKSERGQY